ncbi:MAG: aspartate kinase, partial [Fusobacterium sp. JB021]|nr:aspartate kinase [Fusobacterium sp. JB021]
AIVGRNMVHKPGTSGKLFAAMGNENVNIRVISQSADELNIIIGVDNKDFEKCINVIYQIF